MERDGSLIQGLVWGMSLSVPLWISIIGWLQLFIRLIHKI